MAVNLKDRMGITSGPYELVIDSKRLEAFKAAVGVAKPTPEFMFTFPTVFRKGEFELLDQIGIELKQLLHAEQEYIFKVDPTEIQGGTQVKMLSCLSNVLQKRGGTGGLTFLTFESEFSSKGQVLFISKSVLVLREI